VVLDDPELDHVPQVYWRWLKSQPVFLLTAI
jgi:hypothetical protein